MSDGQKITLLPPYVAMEWYKGSTLPFTVTCTYTDGTAVNLTGATVSMMLKDAAGATALTLQTGGLGIVLTTPISGIMTISPEAVGTSLMSVDKTYDYDIKVTLADTTVTPVVRGIVTFTTKVTT